MLVIKALLQDGAVLAFEPFPLPVGSSAVAFPAGQGMLRQRRIARRKSAFLFRGVDCPPLQSLHVSGALSNA
ncbi:hypothetical protein D8M04_09985 [Oceanobacillus piezotolerans]|uniref:Uncharacterized protein n=1 Tax=Oceanobacillus piezotolerans TaxID=2448030 RepID=A0A498D693_9BACI|nr:hypothetical protein D8M04_09985 [Oceanobacillus piezotolerans]